MVTIIEPKKFVLVGTAGHIDHGKTMLVRNFTGCEVDRLPEEKLRGMTINLGFASCLLKGNVLAGVVDVPGHEKFVRNMVAGVAAIDGIILVVAADDGVMPQTREHVNILELLGIKNGIVALTKIDKVDKEMAEMAAEDVRAFLKGTFLESAPIVPISSVTGEGMEEFWNALNAMVAGIAPRDTRGLFRMPVERKFSVKGLGTVVTGMPISGKVSINDLLELLPPAKQARVRGLQCYKKDSRSAVAGECVAINVPEIPYDGVNRGDVLCAAGHFRAALMVDAKLKMLDSARFALKDNAGIRFHTGTAEIMGIAALLDCKIMHPGDEGFVQFRLEQPTVVDQGDRFIIRLQSPSITIGGGTVLREQDVKLKRFRPYVIEDLKEHEEASRSDFDRIVFSMKRAGLIPLKPKEISKLGKVPVETAEQALVELKARGEAVEISTFGFVHLASLEDGASRIAGLLGEFHASNPTREGMQVLEVRDRLKIDKNAFEPLVDFAVKSGAIARRGNVLALAGFKTALSADDELFLGKIEKVFLDAKFDPPGLEGLASMLGVAPGRAEMLVDLLCDRGELVGVGEGIRFHRQAVEEAEKILVKYLTERTEIGAVSFRDLIGSSRKMAYPLLDHFDVKGVTIRKGNLRYLKSRPQP